MGLAGFPNTSAAPQQGQYHGTGLAAGTAGLQQVRVASEVMVAHVTIPQSPCVAEALLLLACLKHRVLVAWAHWAAGLWGRGAGTSARWLLF
jgi:hypothetical protein